MQSPAGPAVFIQPHADDVALSCGGTAARTAAAGDFAHILTVFAGEIVPQMVGPFAAWKHARWNLHDVDEVVEIRRMEDAAAAKELGCSMRWLGLPDAIYRGDSYTSDEELFGPVREEELALAEHLAEELVGLPEWRVDSTLFVPLAIGSHADHQIVFETGSILAQQGYRVLAYEDAPYVIHTPEGRDRRIDQLGSRVGDPIVVAIGDHLERRIKAIAEYRSQVPVIFRFADNFEEAVTDYARRIGGGVPAERFWPVLAASD